MAQLLRLDGRLRQFLWGLLLVALAVAWNLPLLYPGRHGIFDWMKDIYVLHFFHGAVAEYHTIPVSFLCFPRLLADYPIASTLSYWANPEVPTYSPLALLSLFLPALAAFKVLAALHLSAGAVGIQWVARQAGLGPGGTLALLLCTLLNPWLAQHLAIGYTPWMTACLVPIIVALISGPMSVAALAGASVLNALILYQGGLHVFIWFNVALAGVALVMAALARDLAPVRRPGWLFALTGAVVLPKVWAVAIAYRGIHRLMAHSYASLGDLWGLLTDDRTDIFKFPEAANVHGTPIYDASSPVGTWFLGLLALALLALAFRAWRRREPVPCLSRQIALVVTAVLSIVLGWQGVWVAVTRAVPVLTVEAYPYRFLFVALFLLSVFLVLELDLLARRLPGWRRDLSLVLVFVPVLMVFAPRNHAMAETGAARSDELAAFRLTGILQRVITATRADGTPLRVSARPSEVRIDLDGYQGAVLLPWLSNKAQQENFILVGADAEQPTAVFAPVRLMPRPGETVVKVQARQYGRAPLLVLGFGLWLVILRLAKRRASNALVARRAS